MTGFVKRIVVLALQVAITTTLIAVILSFVSPRRIAETVADGDVALIALAWLLYLWTQYWAACKLRVLTVWHGISLTTLHLFAINIAAQFYALVTPFGFLASSAARWYKISAPDGRRAEALTILVFNRIVEIGVLACLGIAFWAIDGRADYETPIGLVLGGCWLLAMGIYAAAFHRSVSGMLEPAVKALRPVPRVVRDRLAKLVVSLVRSRELPAKHHVAFVGLGIAGNLVGITGVYVAALSIGLDLSFATIAWVRCATSLVLMLPISFAGFGLREASFMVLLQPYGVTEADAVALGLVCLSANLFIAGLGGLIETATLVRRFGPGVGKSRMSNG